MKKTTPNHIAIKLLKTSDNEKTRNADVAQSTAWKVMTADSRQTQRGPVQGSDVRNPPDGNEINDWE